jgi:MFS family permease
MITAAAKPATRLGLRENIFQFALLMLINAMVGGMIGLERTVLPLIATEEFGLTSNIASSSFVISFGLTKAFINLASGFLVDRYGRKSLLVLGWLFGLPVPLLLMFAPNWQWIIVANVLLGINQGLAWSAAVIMKIDLVGSKQRGLAVGLNEFAGYFAVGVTAWLTGYLASVYGLRPVPFVPGIVYSVLGLLLSVFLLRDTAGHLKLEQQQASLTTGLTTGLTTATTVVISKKPSFREVFAYTSWQNPRLFAASQAGLFNNLNDGLSWVIFPLYFASKKLAIEDIGLLKLAYPLVWSLLQIATGAISDRINRANLIAAGMVVQAIGLALTVVLDQFAGWLLATILLGIGTAMVYPSLIAVVSDASQPAWRAQALGVYRFWRDIGYAVGALLAGLIADWLGFEWAIGSVALLTLLSGVIVKLKQR